MSSSWLENIAAQHGGAEVEEEEEEEDVAPPAPVAQAPPQLKIPNESTNEPTTAKAAQQIPSEVKVEKDSTTEKSQTTQPVDKKLDKPEQTIKKPIYEGPISREQFLFAKSMKKLLKGQENEYCLAMINSRRDFAKMMEYSARPLQNASALSGITSDCKTKYDTLSAKILGLPIPMPLKASPVSK